MRTIEEIKKELLKWRIELDNSISASKMPEFLLSQFGGQIEEFGRYVNNLENELKLAIVDGISLPELEKIYQAYKDGRCIILPCKVWDTLYELSYITEEIAPIKPLNLPTIARWIEDSAFGRWLFLTHEEAVAALEAMKKK